MSQGGRCAIWLNGKHISERQAGRLTGTQSVRGLSRLGFDVSAVPRRARYFAFRGRRAERRAHRAQIAHLIRPYPKRLTSAECDKPQ